MKLNLENKYSVVDSKGEQKESSLWDILWDKKTILFFYPKDNTPGCSVENKDFSCMKSDFESLWYKLVWVSKDSVDSHKKFIEKQWLNIDLISDPDLVLHKELGVYWEKNNYWKIVMWVIRSTFIVDNSWEVMNEYRSIRAKWHAERIFKDIQ